MRQRGDTGLRARVALGLVLVLGCRGAPPAEIEVDVRNVGLDHDSGSPVVILEARPVYAYVGARAFGGTVTPGEMVVGFGLAGVLCTVAAVVPVAIAVRRLERV